MTELSPMEKLQLESFISQRDALIAEISERYNVNETLTKENLELQTQNHVLVSEIAENTLKVTESRATTDLILENIAKEKTDAEKDLAITLQKKSEANTELTELINTIGSAASVVKSVVAGATDIQVKMTEIKKEVADSINTITNGAAEVVRVNAETRNAIGEFHNKIVSASIENETRKLKLDKDEAAFQVRKTAFDETYSTVVSIMEREGLTLNDITIQEK